MARIEKKLEKTKTLSIIEGSSYSFMDGFGLRYFNPYVIELGKKLKDSSSINYYIGLLTSIPSILSSLVQLFTFQAMEKYSRKKIVFLSVLLQALMWLPIIGVGFFYYYKNLSSETSLMSLVIIYSLFALFGGFAGPAWNSWMRDIVSNERGNYFGKRNRIAGFIAMLCMLAAGFILDYFRDTKIFYGFIILFTIAFIGRLISSLLFLKHYEPKFKTEKKYYFSIFQFIKRMPNNNFGRFVIYHSLLIFATSIAGPFFVVYTLKTLGFNYIQYTITILASTIISLLSMPLWGRFADKYGTLRTMKINARYIALIPILWALTFFAIGKIDIIYLVIMVCIIEIIGGSSWAGFSLSAGNFIYEAVSRERTSLCFAYFNLLSSIGVLLGAGIGGLVASKNFILLGLPSFIWIMLISAILRYSFHRIMINKLDEAREVLPYKKNFEKQLLTDTIRDTENIIKRSLSSISLRKFSTYLDEQFRSRHHVSN